MPRKIPFDISLIKDALKKSPAERLREACELNDRYELLTPFRPKAFTKTFSSFNEYEQWKKEQDDPRYW